MGKKLSFCKTFSVPERVQVEKLKAYLTNGVLEVIAPKSPKPEPRKLNIQTKALDVINKSDDDLFCISLDLPGVKAQDLEVTSHDENRVPGCRRTQEESFVL